MNQAETIQYLRDGTIQFDFDQGISAMPATAPRVLSFSSGKGGVGKTNIVVNTAIALSRLGQKVLILDADMGLANIDVMLGLTPQWTINHVFAGHKTLQDVVLEGPEGILILPSSSGTTELINLGESEKLFLLDGLEDLASDIDMLFIDNSAGISDNVFYFNMAAQQRVVVVTPEPTSITDAYALIKLMSSRHQVKSFSILVNSVHSANEAKKVYRQLTTVADRFLDSISLDYLGFILKDDSVPRAICQQKALLQVYPDSNAGKGFVTLAQTILNQRLDNAPQGNIVFFWKQLLGRRVDGDL